MSLIRSLLRYPWPALLAAAVSAEGATSGSWPMPRHDGCLTGRSPLAGAILEPRVAGRLPLGAARCERTWPVDVDDDGTVEVLAEVAGGLLAVDTQGRTLWHAETWRTPLATVADLDGDGRVELVLRGPEVRSAMDGRLLWEAPGAAARHEWRILAGSFVPGHRGQQIVAVTLRGYDLRAHVYVFDEGIGAGRVLWERTFQTSDFGDFGSAMVSDLDLDGVPELCVAVQGGVKVLELRTGEQKVQVQWQVGDGQRVRHYGQLLARDVDGDGRPELVLVNTLVALQVAVVKVQDGPGVVVWHRYWGEWYPASPYLLHAAPLSVSDLDGDGQLEIALSLYEHGRGWTLQVLDAGSGAVKAAAPGLYLDAVLPRAGKASLLLCSSQSGPLPARFATVHGLSVSAAALAEEWQRPDARLEGQWSDLRQQDAAPLASRTADQRDPVLWKGSGDGRPQLVIAQDRDGDGRTDRLAALDEDRAGAWTEGAVWHVDPQDDVSVLRAIPGADGPTRLLVADSRGEVWCLDAEGAASARFCAGGAFTPGAAVADIDGDGRNEVVASSSSGEVGAFRFLRQGDDGSFACLWRRQAWGTAGQQPAVESPLLADVDDDAAHEVLVGVYTRGQGAGLECLGGDGTRRWVWRVPAPVPGPEQRAVRTWTVGRFGGRGALDVFVSTRAGDQTGGDMAQECWALDGSTGTALWHRTAADMVDFYWSKKLGPSALPSVSDVDHDGIDEVLMMSESLVVTLDGRDGRPRSRPVSPTMVFGEGTPWTAAGSVSLLDVDGDGIQEQVLTATVGGWAVLTQGERGWLVDPGTERDCRYHGGVGDVDGDGRLELGMPHGLGFRCYDAASGTLKWCLDGLVGTTDVVTADIDGDGRDEFVLGAGRRLVAVAGGTPGGHLLWSLDLGAQAGPPLLADVDGDGRAEVVVGAADGALRVISGER
ncbi:MAG: hypothetical protein AB1505_35685 [Candidatus Latescibacterota bacterium]